MTETPREPSLPRRHFLPATFTVSDWSSLEGYFHLLEDAPLHSANDLHQWLLWKDELEAVLQEDLAWRYIRMTCHTDRQDYSEAYTYFVTELQPRIAEAQHRLQQRFAQQPWRHELPIEGIELLNRLIDNEIELFRSENLPLKAQESQLSQQYGATVGAMTVTLEGEELTLPQAGRYLLEHDRTTRQHAWEAIQHRRAQDAPALDRLFDQLVGLRHRIARNAGFDTYIDYRFRELARFDYGRQACLDFHHAVETVVRPLYEQQLDERRERLHLDRLRPWDLRVDWWSERPLKPFSGEADLIARTEALFAGLHPRFAEVVRLLAQSGHLDLASRKNKAPGGYNYPLMESGVPFIFMNAADQHSDLKTMVHECGHAIHAVLAHACVPLAALRDVPSEVAELASMGMELLTLDRWGSFYADPRDLARAQHQHLTGLVGLLPWIATVDAFQFWIYEHPEHSSAQRAEAWVSLYHRFHGSAVDWSGYEEWLRQSWQAQLHLYEVPFYYIEYGIAQLGALQLWQRYRTSPREALRDYQAALSLGYTRTIPELYAAAGIAFDFSPQRMEALFQDVGQAVAQTSRVLA
jgi:oligoendopeptidase F